MPLSLSSWGVLSTFKLSLTLQPRPAGFRFSRDRWLAVTCCRTEPGRVGFEHLVRHVKSERQRNGRPAYRERWWIHVKTVHDHLCARWFTIYPGQIPGLDTFRLANRGAIDRTDIEAFLEELRTYRGHSGIL